MKKFIIVIAALCSFGYASMGLCDDSPIDLVKMYFACMESGFTDHSTCKLRTADDIQKIACDGTAKKMMEELKQEKEGHENWEYAKIDHSKLRFQVVEKGSDYQLVLVTGPVTSTLIDVKGKIVDQGTRELRPNDLQSYQIVIKERGRWLICDEERRRAKMFREIDVPPAPAPTVDE